MLDLNKPRLYLSGKHSLVCLFHNVTVRKMKKSEWNLLFIHGTRSQYGCFTAMNTACRFLAVKVRADGAKECNIWHSNWDIAVKGWWCFVCAIRVSGWRIIHHQQGCVIDFELCRDWSIRIGQHQSSYCNNTPILILITIVHGRSYVFSCILLSMVYFFLALNLRLFYKLIMLILIPSSYLNLYVR